MKGVLDVWWNGDECKSCVFRWANGEVMWVLNSVDREFSGMQTENPNTLNWCSKLREGPI